MGRTGPEDLDKQLRFHHTEWWIQRVGWVLVALFLGLAAAGLFGGGPLSHARAQAATGRIEYERFVRNGSPAELVITSAGGGARGVSSIEISADYLEAFRVERVTPEPKTVRRVGGQLVYEFASSSAGAVISFQVDPQQLWRHRAVVRIDNGPPLEIWQIIYP
jgi:hypothetical protein